MSGFIEEIAKYVVEYAPQYEIRACSAVIAQAVLESGWGESRLAKQYRNYFGLKCGSKWTGPSVNMATKEEYTPGIKTDIRANFRVYPTMREGVRGYFEFIQLERYHNLRNVTDPAEYLRLIKSDGYATASNYVADVMGVVDAYDLRKYDPKERESDMTDREITLIGHGSGRPAKHNLYTYSAQRYAQKAPNGRRKGVVAVRRLRGMTAAKRSEFVREIAVTIGRNRYSQSRRGYVYHPYSNGIFYSDCSAIGMATLKRIGFKFPWLYNTAAIYEESEFETVPVKIVDGHIMNPEVLEVADAILYRGNDPSRPEQIGHVEWVYAVPDDGEGYPKQWPDLDNGRQGAGGTGYYKRGDGIESKLNYTVHIKRIQRLINWIDDTLPDVKVDGRFGAKTEKKVNAVRELFGLDETGKFTKTVLDKCQEFKK